MAPANFGCCSRARLRARVFGQHQMAQTGLRCQGRASASTGQWGLTIRSSRTRIGAAPGCFSATLAPSRHPAAGRLNSGVRCSWGRLVGSSYFGHIARGVWRWRRLVLGLIVAWTVGFPRIRHRRLRFQSAPRCSGKAPVGLRKQLETSAVTVGPLPPNNSFKPNPHQGGA